MKILDHRALRGPNRYSRHPTIFMLLDIGELVDRPSDTLPGFSERLVALLPTLQQHRCSVGEPGGFIQRLHRGTWAAHIVEHVALELQCLAGMEVGFGKSRGTSARGVYDVVYRYRVESAGLLAGRRAVALVAAVVAGEPCDVAADVAELKVLREKDMLGPSTRSIVNEAKRRGIFTLRLNDESLVQLGCGVKQHRIQATMTDRTSALGVELADEKFRTKRLLQRAGLPTPRGALVESVEEALHAADSIGYPVAVKPEVGNHGRGITARVPDERDLEAAFAFAHEICSSVIVEKTLTGFDFRVLVIDGKFVAAARREPAHVIGDGRHTIQQLVDLTNADPRRGIGHERNLTAISIDGMTQRLLEVTGHRLHDVLPVGEKLFLKSTANLSTGGTAQDVTAQVHPDVRLMCERTARLVGLDCVGIDIVAPGLENPLDAASAGIIEVNAAPGFRMHLDPSEGEPHDVARPFVEMLFPLNESFDVPIVAVTGTNGKTTTSRIIAHVLKYGGNVVGLAGTTGVEIDGNTIAAGDYSGPDGARMVFCEPTVDHAVLEVARGGILRRGLGFDDCHVGVLLNVDHDHIGTDGVNDLEDLASVKATVIEVVRETGVAVLNADDPTVVGLRERTRARVIYFSLDSANPTLIEHLQEGGTAVVLQGDEVVIRTASLTVNVLPVEDIPITLRGAARFNTANVLAAVAALHGLGVSVDTIRVGIGTFHPSPSQNPGRMNIIDFRNFTLLLDYGHNVPAIEALSQVLPSLTTGKKIVVAHGTGNRLAESIEEFGAALARVYDHIVLCDADPRSREPGETPALVRKGILASGALADRADIVLDPLEAIDRAFEIVQAGDLVVVQVDKVEPMLGRVMLHFDRLVGSRLS